MDSSPSSQLPAKAKRSLLKARGTIAAACGGILLLSAGGVVLYKRQHPEPPPPPKLEPIGSAKVIGTNLIEFDAEYNEDGSLKINGAPAGGNPANSPGEGDSKAREIQEPS